MNIKKKETKSGYTMTEKAKTTKRTQRIKRKLEDFDYISALLAFLAIIVLSCMAAGFIDVLNTPVSRFDNHFSRFLDLLCGTLIGAMAGIGIVIVLLILGACFIAIGRFISNLWG